MKKNLLLNVVFLFLLQQVYSQPVNTNISNGVIFDGEPYLAMNPTNSKNLVAAWMGMKLTGGVFRIAIKTRASFDQGTTWSTTNSLPHFGTGYGSADVSMGFAKNGVLYLCYIDYRQSPDSGGVYVARSRDGGLTWDTPTLAIDMYEDALKKPIDRPWMVVDNSITTNSGTLYITTKPPSWVAPPNRNYYKTSSDSGLTWSAIAYLDGGTHLVGGSIAQPMAAPAATMNGYFCAAYPSYVSSQNVLPAYYLASSKDKGQTISYSTMLAAVPGGGGDTNLKNGYRLIADPNDTNKMAFLLPSGSGTDADIIALHSNNGGQTWSSTVRVNDDAVGNGIQQDMVWGAYNETGDLIVTWRDRRKSGVSGFWNAGYEFYYSQSFDNGQNFTANQVLSSQAIAFDSVLAQNGNDFMSCVYRGDSLFTVWGDTRDGKMNIYFSKTIASTNTSVDMMLLDGEEHQWSVFPNPANDLLNVQASDELINKDISMFDAWGKRIFHQTIDGKMIKINIQNLNNGIYFLKVVGEVKKIVKE